MQYNILHETHYTYPEPVVVSHQLLHVAPRPLPWQITHFHQTTIEPEPGERSERLDYFGNTLVQVALVALHESLLVRAQSSVSVATRGGEAQAVGSQAWEGVRDLLRMPATGAQPGTLIEATGYLYESPHAG
ncbi:MAG: transglutaminase family protein, partial [Proteobacteria bacterium]|nr:transglutaminase family protein [Pseudomonadota bacterium]